jgi:hypothetical protein
MMRFRVIASNVSGDTTIEIKDADFSGYAGL